MIPVYYSPAYVAAAHAFPTTRKAGWIADSMHAEPLPGIEIREPEPLTREQLAGVHDPAYIRAIETGQPRELAESQSFPWDPGLWSMVCASNGGAVAAALAAMRHGTAGSLSSGLHHARREHGCGFCTFNGLVLAARTALAHGARQVLILDLDAHAGGGTASLIAGESRIRQIDVSVNGFDRYQSSEQATLDQVTQPQDYLPTIQRRLEEFDEHLCDLCLYNAGMDPHEHCPTGGLRGITEDLLRERERLVFDWCRRRSLPIAFVLAGGYLGPRLDQEQLVRLHRLTLEAASAGSGAEKCPASTG